jgi:hypothetical protein
MQNATTRHRSRLSESNAGVTQPPRHREWSPVRWVYIIAGSPCSAIVVRNGKYMFCLRIEYCACNFPAMQYGAGRLEGKVWCTYIMKINTPILPVEIWFFNVFNGDKELTQPRGSS